MTVEQDETGSNVGPDARPVAPHAPGPWEWRNVAGAGLELFAVLPAGFKLEGTAREANGETSFMIWGLPQSLIVQIGYERWVQFSTGSWDQMQEANARLMAAAPDLLETLLAIKRHGELGNVDAGTVSYTGGKKPASKDVWQFPRHMLPDIDAAIAKASGS